VGRTEAAERWYGGEHGPDAPIARQAPAHCVSCGFFVPVTGALGLAFGICANEYAPDDGRVVSVDHGCGAHSEGFPTVIDLVTREVPDELDDIAIVADEDAPAGDDSSAAAALGDDSEETAAFGHS
ncbi:MAG: hypothetical protein QOG49_1262, partial [Frankiaceae bacterium]|nr:hypothetical protein [Frankiaceae bacterium]